MGCNVSFGAAFDAICSKQESNQWHWLYSSEEEHNGEEGAADDDEFTLEVGDVVRVRIASTSFADLQFSEVDCNVSGAHMLFVSHHHPNLL